LIDALYTSIWSWIGADLGLSLDVYVAGSSHAVVLITASLWNDEFFSPHILSVIFRNCFNLHRELFFKFHFTCAYLVRQLLIILQKAKWQPGEAVSHNFPGFGTKFVMQEREIKTPRPLS